MALSSRRSGCLALGGGRFTLLELQGGRRRRARDHRERFRTLPHRAGPDCQAQDAAPAGAGRCRYPDGFGHATRGKPRRFLAGRGWRGGRGGDGGRLRGLGGRALSHCVGADETDPGTGVRGRRRTVCLFSSQAERLEVASRRFGVLPDPEGSPRPQPKARGLSRRIGRNPRWTVARSPGSRTTVRFSTAFCSRPRDRGWRQSRLRVDRALEGRAHSSARRVGPEAPRVGGRGPEPIPLAPGRRNSHLRPERNR